MIIIIICTYVFFRLSLLTLRKLLGVKIMMNTRFDPALGAGNTGKAQVELSESLLAHLLNSGLLHCGDCKSLNANAKAVIWHSLLESVTTKN